MKQLYFFLGGLLLSPFALLAQSESSKDTDKEVDNAATKDFYYGEIPAVINGSNLDPFAVSNISADFTTSKLQLKIGLPYVFKKAPDNKSIKHTGFVEPYVKATNSVATLWSADSRPVEFGVKGGYSYVWARNFWVYLDENGNRTNQRSSEAMKWTNVIFNIERGNYNIFYEEKGFDMVNFEKKQTNGSIYLTFNRYFFSDIDRFKKKANIFSIGLGYAKTDNYTSLKSRTLEEGRLLYNSDSSSYRTVVKTTAGRQGEFKVYQGMTVFGELFVPIVRNREYGGLYWGNQITYYGIGKDESIVNGSTGIYVNIKDGDLKGNNSAKDKFNFSVVARFKQLNQLSEDEYVKNNFSLTMQVAVPLLFN